MSLNNTLSIQQKIGAINIRLSTWLVGNNKVASVISFQTGPVLVQENMNIEQSELMIKSLQQHIENIKTNDLELISLQTKVTV